MLRSFSYLLCIVSLLVSCKKNKIDRVISGSKACWSDTLKFQGEEKQLLKSYFELIKAFENKDTVKLLSLLSDSVYCGECKRKDSSGNYFQAHENYDKLSFLKINWNHYLYWKDSKAGALLNIVEETNEYGRVGVGDNCRGEECGSTLLIYEKVNNKILLKQYITMP